MKFKSIVIFLVISLFSQHAKAMLEEQEKRRNVTVIFWGSTESSDSSVDKSHISLQTDKYYISLWPGDDPNQVIVPCLEYRESAPYVLAVSSEVDKSFAKIQGLDNRLERSVPLYVNSINALVNDFMKYATDFKDLETEAVLGKVIKGAKWGNISTLFSGRTLTDARLVSTLLYAGGISSRYQEYSAKYLQNIIEEHASSNLIRIENQDNVHPQGVLEFCDLENEIDRKFHSLDQMAREIGNPEFLYFQPHHLKEMYAILFKRGKNRSYQTDFANYMRELKATYESDNSLMGYVYPSSWWRYATGEWRP